MKGPRVMSFGATKTDEDRLSKVREATRMTDSCPSEPEWRAWSMRPRNKSKELGPSMRFNSHFQAERLMETLKSNTQAFFSAKEVTGKQNGNQELESQIKHYIRTGDYETPDTENKANLEDLD